jgi:DNA-binding GntR family transcriptional regulator
VKRDAGLNGHGPADLDAGQAAPARNVAAAVFPAYARIAKTLSDRLASGEYSTGSRLPSGSQLCAEFGVSPMTVRRALNMLENQGLISGVKGRGTYARSVGLSDSSFRLDTSDWLGESSEIRVLSATMTRADDESGQMLAVAPGTRLIYLRRLVVNDGKPAMYDREYVIYDPRRPLVESQLQLTSLHAFLEPGKAQVFPRGELMVTAASLDAESAEILDESDGAIAIRLEHVFQDADRTPVSWGWFLLRPQLFRLRAQFGAE